MSKWKWETSSHEKSEMKIEMRNVHMKPAHADTELIPAHVSKATNKMAKNDCSWHEEIQRKFRESNPIQQNCPRQLQGTEILP
jgi:predicted RNA-binding protein (virulence factor B family)